MVVRPFRRPFELRDVPAPELVQRGGQKFWCGVDQAAPLRAPLTVLAVRGEHALHRALGIETRALVEQRGVHLRRREIKEARRAQHIDHVLVFAHREGAHAGSTWPGRLRGPPPPTSST